MHMAEYLSVSRRRMRPSVAHAVLVSLLEPEIEDPPATVRRLELAESWAERMNEYPEARTSK